MMMGFWGAAGAGVMDQGWWRGWWAIGGARERRWSGTGWVRGDPVSVGRYEDCDGVCAELPVRSVRRGEDCEYAGQCDILAGACKETDA
jgi:hypothetical protein